MAAPTHRGRSRYTLGLLILSALTLLTLDFQGFGPLETAQNGLRSAFSPVRSIGNAVSRPVTNGAQGLFNYGELEAENSELRLRIAELEGQSFQTQVDQDELERLKDQAGLDSVGDIPVEIAEVVSGPLGNFSGQSVEINKGKLDGVRDGMPVITSAGLVGRVLEAGRNRSTVQLITDPDFTVGIRVTADGEVGLAHGDGAGSPDQITVDQGISDGVSVGDLIITSGGRTSRFPPGLAIGIVSDVIDKDRGLELKVALQANPTDIGFVNVVLYEAAE